MVRKALALEGGSLRCMFTAGAVDVMMERGLEAEVRALLAQHLGVAENKLSLIKGATSPAKIFLKRQ